MTDGAFVPTYGLPVLLGIALLLFYPAPPHVKRPEHARGYRAILVVTIVCAVAGAKLAALMGDKLWPAVPLEDGWRTVVLSGRSIVGGVLFGHVGSELARPLLGYTAPPNDRIAVALCASVAVGRVGCALSGCCLGVPYEGPLALTTDGVARFPSAPVELVFHVAFGAALFVLERRRALFGRLFSLYLVVYGAFRFATEPLRVTPKALWGLSVYQWLALACVLVGALGLWWRSTSPVWRARLAAPGVAA